MSAAVWAFLGVVLGGVLTGAVSLWQAQLVTKREREAREALREQERKDRRDAFQRETLLALQDAVEDVRRAISRDADRKLAALKEDGRWPRRMPGEAVPEDLSDAHARVGKFYARIFDDELKTSVAKFRWTTDRAIIAQSEGESKEGLWGMTFLDGEINSRIGIVLPQLY
jgi:hypothetical protein